MEDWSQFAPVDSVESFDQFEEVKDSTKLPSLPEVPSDTPVDYSFVGFANPTTLSKAQKAAEQVMAEQEQRYNPSPVDWSHFGFTNPTGETYEQLLAESPSKDNRIVQYIAKHPFETGAGLAAGLLTPTGAGIPASIAIAGLSSGAGNIADQAIFDRDTTRSFGERATEAGVTTGASALGAGLGYGISAGLNRYAAPYFKAIADYGEKTAAVQAFKKWLSEIPKEKAAYELGMLRSLGTDPANLRVPKITSLLSEAKPGEDILSLIRNNKEIGDAVAEQVGYKMIDEIPAHQVFGPPNLEGMSLEEALVASRAPELPSKWNIGQYILENTKNPVAPVASEYAIPDALKDYLARTSPGIALTSKLPVVRNMAASLADFASPKLLSGARSIAPVVHSASPVAGVASGILGSEATRTVQDKLKNYELPPVY